MSDLIKTSGLEGQNLHGSLPDGTLDVIIRVVGDRNSTLVVFAFILSACLSLPTHGDLESTSLYVGLMHFCVIQLPWRHDDGRLFRDYR